MAEAVLLAVLGSNWSASATVAVLVCASGETTVAATVSVCRRRGGDRPDIPQTSRRGVGPLARSGRHEGQPGRQHVGDLDTGGSVGAGIVGSDRERHLVTDVRCRIADRLRQRQIGLWRRRSSRDRRRRRCRCRHGGRCGRGRSRRVAAAVVVVAAAVVVVAAGVVVVAGAVVAELVAGAAVAATVVEGGQETASAVRASLTAMLVAPTANATMTAAPLPRPRRRTISSNATPVPSTRNAISTASEELLPVAGSGQSAITPSSSGR